MNDESYRAGKSEKLQGEEGRTRTTSTSCRQSNRLIDL